MKETIFTGSGVAIVTPFDKDNQLNEEKLRQLIEYQIDHNTDAIIICGTTGESPVLTDEEHVKAISIAVEQTKGRVPVIAGTGSNDTSYGISLSQRAEKIGADALLLVTPYYNKTTQAGLIRHFNTIADRVSIPMILYNVPSRTGMSIAPETYYELSKHPNIVATKEASGNFSAIAKSVQLCGDDLTFYSGNDDQIVPILSLGGKGVISVLANILPKETHDICSLFFEGNIKDSAALQLKLLDLIDALFIEVNPIPVKTAMNLMGLQVGDLRCPLAPMGENTLLVLKKMLKKYNIGIEE